MKKSANMSFVNGRPIGHSSRRAVGHTPRRPVGDSSPFGAPSVRSASCATARARPFLSASLALALTAALALPTAALAVTATKAYVDSRDASLSSYVTGVSNKVVAAQSAADANASKIAALTSADVKNAAVEDIYTAQRKMSEEVVVSDGTNAVVVTPKELVVIDTTKAMPGRFFTFPDNFTGQLATTDDIPEVPTAVSAFENDAGYLTAESDPAFAAWTNGAHIAAGYGAFATEANVALGYQTKSYGYASVALGGSAEAHSGVAIGYQAYINCTNARPEVAFSAPIDGFYLGSSATNAGSTARSLQSYLDERATTGALAEVKADLAAKADRYRLATPASNTFTAADGCLYAYAADASGVFLTLPAAKTDVTQDFALRLGFASGATNTALSVTIPSGVTADFPLGTNLISGTISAPTYFTFTQTSPTTWSISAYAATKKED
jgi:hypothetical protein